MAAQDYYETNVPTETIDTSASTRKFQTSIIIKQDENKSGILSFLSDIEPETTPTPRTSPQTIRPRRREGY
jgi:hypothetical protein